MKNNKRELIIYFIIVIVALIMFYNFVIGHYAVDTYAIANKGYENYAKNIFLKARQTFFGIIINIRRYVKYSDKDSCYNICSNCYLYIMLNSNEIKKIDVKK